MTTIVQGADTLLDLEKHEGKAELINGRIVPIMSTGRVPARVGGNIYIGLKQYEASTRRGEGFPDNLGYAIRPPLANGRESFAPDASYYLGPGSPDEEGFIDGPPTFAVEVRSQHDYIPSKDLEYADKRADYFQAGTLVVWDVDYRAETVSSYRASDPLRPLVFRLGDVADAEPALPGWRLAVTDIFS